MRAFLKQLSFLPRHDMLKKAAMIVKIISQQFWIIWNDHYGYGLILAVKLLPKRSILQCKINVMTTRTINAANIIAIIANSNLPSKANLIEVKPIQTPITVSYTHLTLPTKA